MIKFDDYNRLGDICKVIRGERAKKSDFNEGPYAVVAGGGKPLTFGDRKTHEAGTVTVALDGSAGWVLYWDDPVFVSASAASIIPKCDLPAALIYALLRRDQKQLFDISKPSTSVCHLSIPTLSDHQLFIPNDIRDRFDDLMNAFKERDNHIELSKYHLQQSKKVMNDLLISLGGEGEVEDLKPKETEGGNTAQWRIDAKERDAWFTPPELAQELVNKAKAKCDELGIHNPIWVEPSAGAGAFIDALDANHIAMDIEPCADGIIKQDFLEWMWPQYDGNRYVAIGNPPFGVQGQIAVKFIEHCSHFCDAVFMIVPHAIRKRKTLGKFKQIHWQELDETEFVWPDGSKTRPINTAFVMYSKIDNSPEDLLDQKTHSASNEDIVFRIH